jgi:hypothetical protein
VPEVVDPVHAGPPEDDDDPAPLDPLEPAPELLDEPLELPEELLDEPNPPLELLLPLPLLLECPESEWPASEAPEPPELPPGPPEEPDPEEPEPPAPELPPGPPSSPVPPSSLGPESDVAHADASAALRPMALKTRTSPPTAEVEPPNFKDVGARRILDMGKALDGERRQSRPPTARRSCSSELESASF